MPKPEDVNPWNFEVREVIYDNNGFSVAWGIWEEDNERLAMRWNGDGTDAGYPKTFGNPVWFLIPEELGLPFSKTLRDLGSSSKN